MIAHCSFQYPAQQVGNLVAGWDCMALAAAAADCLKFITHILWISVYNDFYDGALKMCTSVWQNPFSSCCAYSRKHTMHIIWNYIYLTSMDVKQIFSPLAFRWSTQGPTLTHMQMTWRGNYARSAQEGQEEGVKDRGIIYLPSFANICLPDCYMRYNWWSNLAPATSVQWENFHQHVMKIDYLSWYLTFQFTNPHGMGSECQKMHAFWENLI